MSSDEIPLGQHVFEGMPSSIVVACVDHDGTLKYGDSILIRYHWDECTWKGANWIDAVFDTKYEKLTAIRRNDAGDNGAVGESEIPFRRD